MYKISRIWHVILAFTLLITSSCKDDDNPEELYLRLETTSGSLAPTTLAVGREGINQSYVIKSNGSWNLSLSSSGVTWLSVYPEFGKNDGSFNLKVEANPTTSSRTAKLTGSIDGKEAFTLTIEQSALDVAMKVTPTSLAILPAEGDEIEFAISTNADAWEYALSENADWITEKSKSDNELILAVAANPTEDKREAMVSFTVPSEPTIKQEIKVSQQGVVIVKKPVADLLDFVFKTDGTAENIASSALAVATIEGGGLTTVYSNTFQRYIARFNHSAGSGISAGYYKADYASDQSFKNALADGHTLETMFTLDADRPLPNLEIKMFSSHEGGGTGFLIGNNSRGNSIIFLPNVGSGYVWTNSGIVPEPGKHYHVVGVWNKQEGKSYIYINGELKATANTTGDLKFPSIQWFGVGADAGNPPQTAWNGDVVLARAYDKPLSAEEIGLLWTDVEAFTPDPSDLLVSDITLLSKRVVLDGTYSIKGKGFAAGDKIKLVPVSGSGADYTCDGKNRTDHSIEITIPTDFVSGKYRFNLVRGGQTLDMGFATLTVVENLPEGTKVIAHRGYWKAGVPQNSVAALAKAQGLGLYGAEFDVWITTDGEVVLNHDATLSNGVVIETASYDDIKNFTLSNGEKLPTLKDYLEQGKKDPSTKLILEIKSHSKSTGGISNNNRVAEACVNMVKAAGMTAQVEYIAFSLDVCKKVLELQPDAIVAYLNGDKTPQSLHDLKIKGIDYNISVLRSNPGWIIEAQNLGMTVNVWTVNSESDILQMIDQGVDYITTDEPEVAKRLIDAY